MSIQKNDLNPGYYQEVRLDAISLLSGRIFENALEIGCASGNTLGHLKTIGQAKRVHGLDQSEFAASLRNQALDSYVVADAEVHDFGSKKFDLILLLDVLEHLRDPFTLVQRCQTLLTGKGLLLISIPNINNLRILKKLILNNDFPYTDSGLLDRTHLRFFTDRSFLREMSTSCPSFKLVGEKKNWDYIPGLNWLRIVPFFRKFFVFQHVFLFERN